MAGSMGFAVNNTKAVIEGLIGKKSEFKRTPKYMITDKGDDAWKANKYAPTKVEGTGGFEILFPLYFLFGVCTSIYYLEIAAVPFQLMFLGGFGFVAYLSVKHAWLRRARA